MPVHTFDNNMFDTNRLPPWSVIGSDVSDASDIEEVLAASGLDYTVEMRPLAYTDSPHSMWPVYQGFPQRYATVGIWPDGHKVPFECVSGRYHPYQNIDAFAFCQGLIDDGDATFSAAGYMRDGRSVFIAMNLPDSITVGGVDPMNRFLLVWNSHDGTSGIRGAVTTVRLFCLNQLPALTRGFRYSADSFNIRHSATAGEKVNVIREALQISFEHESEVATEYERMVRTGFSRPMYYDLAEELIPMPEEADDEQVEAIDEQRSVLVSLYDSDNLEHVKGTAYAAYQAAVEYADWYKPLRAVDQGTARAKAQLTRRFDSFKERAFELTRAA